MAQLRLSKKWQSPFFDRQKRKARNFAGFSLGAPAEIRTPDTLLKRQVLYLLSYWGKYMRGIYNKPSSGGLTHRTRAQQSGPRPKRRRTLEVEAFLSRGKRRPEEVWRRGWDGGTRTHYIGVKVRCVTITLHPNVQVDFLTKRPALPAFSRCGVGYGARTHDTRNHNPVLCQLS